jgi:DNA integrity scanning protein DisA with diadenylate cyclase activity
MTVRDQEAEFATLFGLAMQLAKLQDAEAIVLWAHSPLNWELVARRRGELAVVVGAETSKALEGALEAGLDVIVVEPDGTSIQRKLSQVMVQGIAADLLRPNATVVALYGGFDEDGVDSVSCLELDEHLERLTARDLRKLGTNIPLETLRLVVELAVDIGREGREGKPVGTMFVVGDSKNVLARCHPIVFDPVKGYPRKERSLRDPKVREGIKEIAQLDGAFVVAGDGTVEAACQLIETQAANITLSKGLGTRHWAAAAISKSTAAVAVTVSQSCGTVRIFQNGEVVLRVEPFRSAMKWKAMEME